MPDTIVPRDDLSQAQSYEPTKKSPFFPFPRSLWKDDAYLELTATQRDIFTMLMELACWKACTQDDHGVKILLQPGQMLITLRELQRKGPDDYTKSTYEYALSVLEKRGFCRQDCRHLKTVITITYSGCYMHSKENSQTGLQTDYRQDTDIKEEYKNLNLDKKSAGASPMVNLKPNVTMTQDQHAELLAKFGSAKLERLATRMHLYKNSRGFSCECDFSELQLWDEKDQARVSGKLKEDPQPTNNKELALKILKPIVFNHGKCRGGYDVNNKQVTIDYKPGEFSPLEHFELNLSEHGFDQQLSNRLRKWGLIT